MRNHHWRNTTAWYEKLPRMTSMDYSTLYNINPHFPICETKDIPKFMTFQTFWNKAARYSYSSQSYFHAVFTFGPQNYVLAGLGTDRTIYFPNPNHHNMFDYFRDDEEITNEQQFEMFKPLYEKLFLSCYNIIKSYDLISTNDPLNRQDLMVKMLAKIQRSMEKRHYTTEVTPEWIYNNVKDSLNVFFNEKESQPTALSRQMLLNKNNLYREAIYELQARSESMRDKSFKEGLLVGTKVFSGFIKAGYVPREDGAFVKECWIRPEYALYGNVTRQLDEKDRYYCVEEIVFHPHKLTGGSGLELYCVGRHPNVGSDTKICVGSENQDLYHKIITKKDVSYEDLVNLLYEVEKALEVINYDSAYYGAHEGMKDRWKEVDTMPYQDGSEEDRPVKREIRRV